MPSTSYTVSYSQPCFSESNVQRIGGLALSNFGFIPKFNTDLDPEGATKVEDFLFDIAFAPNSQGQTSGYTLTQRRVEAVGCGPVESTSQENEGWITNWYGYLADNYVDPQGGIIIRNWDKVGDGNGDIMATKTISGIQTEQSRDANGSIKFVLFHKPDPA